MSWIIIKITISVEYFVIRGKIYSISSIRIEFENKVRSRNFRSKSAKSASVIGRSKWTRNSNSFLSVIHCSNLMNCCWRTCWYTHQSVYRGYGSCIVRSNCNWSASRSNHRLKSCTSLGFWWLTRNKESVSSNTNSTKSYNICTNIENIILSSKFVPCHEGNDTSNRVIWCCYNSNLRTTIRLVFIIKVIFTDESISSIKI